MARALSETIAKTTKPKPPGAPRARASSPDTALDAARAAAALLGALGGRGGRGDAKRRPTAHYRRIALRSAGWRSRTETFFLDGAAILYRTAAGVLWSLGAGGFHLCEAAVLEAVPRTARLLRPEDVPAAAARLARMLGATDAARGGAS